MTTTLTRTLTSRAGQSTPQPEWLYSTQHGTPMGLDGTATPTQTPGEIERGRTLSSDRQLPGRAHILSNSVRQDESRTASISSRTAYETGNNAARRVAEEEHLRSGSGEEVAGLGYASLHNAKDNIDVPAERNIGEGTMEEVKEVAPHTVHSRYATEADEAGSGRGELNSGERQVQFAQ